MEPRAIYVHAPFCRRRCGYCDFAVTVAADADPRAWAEAVALELSAVAARERWSLPLRPRTLYVGGGTPSLFGADGMAALRHALADLVDLSALKEWTAEANPESFDSAVARGWADAGVDRLSLGAQTFHGPALRWMGRLHGPDGPARALEAAREAGLTNISLDLIFGLPERLGRDWERDLDCALRLEPTHLSLYGLTAEPGTPLGRWVAEGRERLADGDGYAEEYLLAAGRLSDSGWDHYEVSNFCRPGWPSAHNEAYWDGTPYVGLGPGAHSFAGSRRWWNLRDWRAYRSAVERGEAPAAGAETVSGETRALEELWLGLRTAEGVALVDETEMSIARGWVNAGLARFTSAARVRLTAEGWLLLDRLAVELSASGGRDAASERAGRAAMATGMEN